MSEKTPSPDRKAKQTELRMASPTRPESGQSQKTGRGKIDDLRLGWAAEALERTQARADQFFMADEDIPLSQHLLLVLVAAFFFVAIVWAFFAGLDQVTRGDGRVVPSSEIQILQSLEGGIIDEFLVREGEEVKAGQAVIRLRDVQASSDLGANRSRFLALQAKLQRLRAEAEGLATPEFSADVMANTPQSVQEELETFWANRSNIESQTNILNQQLSQREQEVRETESRLSDLRDVIRLSRQERDMIAPLVERGSAPEIELIQLERGLREQQSELNALQAQLPRLRSATDEVQARIEEITSAAKAQAQTELTATLAEINALRETLTALEDRKVRTEIKSPVNGFVKDIKVSTVGGVVQPGADLIEIVPRDDQLIIEARIRPSDIAFLHPGQAAVVKITAYDFAIYGGLEGELVSISPDAITTPEGETFYRVRIRTPQTYLVRKGEHLDIIPGMVASVDILTGEKTVMEYLLKPFIKTLDVAMSER